MGDLKMMYPSIVTTPSRSTAIQRRLAWGLAARPPAPAAIEGHAGEGPHRLAAPGVAAGAPPHRAAEGDQKELRASGYVLIVDDDPDLLDVTSFVIENEGM